MEDLKREEIISVQKSVSKDFVNSGFTSLIPNNDFERLEEFRIYLIEKLAKMLDNDFNILVNTLYRIDISEKKLSELFSGKDRRNIPEKLADLIIERQIQKIKFRQKYRDGNL